MTWTSELPKVAGWYFWKPNESPQASAVVSVANYGKGFVFSSFGPVYPGSPVAELGGWWQGPIDTPPGGPSGAEQEAAKLYDDLRDYPPKERSNWEAVVATALVARERRKAAALECASQYDVTYKYMHESIAKEYEDFAAAIRSL